MNATEERKQIAKMFDKANALRNNPGAYFPARNAARKALEAWRQRYPVEAAAEDTISAKQDAAIKAYRQQLGDQVDPNR
jgi:hypothetical protein